ncbi:MAG: hypothetical protein JXR77_12405 [Lentisphaeria bacterium]|nr:hypothetical protein [Lentisphaeria bacterium]
MNRRKRSLGLWALAVLACSAPVVFAQSDGYAEFRNSWPVPEGDGWAASTAVYSGHVDDAVTDGTCTLHWSRIGQAVEGPTREGSHFDIGEEITSAENVALKLVPAAALDPAGELLYWEPTILDPDTGEPSDRAFYLPHARKVFASAAGSVQITWKGPGGNAITFEGANGEMWGPAVTYLISDKPARPAVRIYWTDRYDALGNLTPTGAPPVDIAGFHVVPHYHTAIPARLSDEMDPPVPPNPDDYDGDPYPPEGFDAVYQQYQRDLQAYVDAQNTRFLWKFGDSLRAQGRTGYVVVEFNADESTFIDVEIVELRRYSPDPWPAHSPYGPQCDVGSEFLPQGGVPAAPTRVDAYVARGLTGESPYVYQHGVDGPDRGNVYAVRPTSSDLQIEVFWRKSSLLDNRYEVLWPYQMRRYEAVWPDDPQIFVRGHSEDNLGRPVTVPDSLHPELMLHQEFAVPGTHATLEGNVVDANGEGLFLLRYNPGTPPGSTGVFFEVVRAVRHDRARPDMEGILWPIASGVFCPIGRELGDAYHEGTEPGHVHVCDYTADDAGYRDSRNDRYAADIYRDAVASTGQIFPVNAGMLEVWWCNLSQGVPWPSKVVRYRCDWPAAGDPELQPPLVIASELGTGPIDRGTHPNWSLYVQNDPEEAGFNPNDEHALALDPAEGPVFALRDDLGSDATSWPYVLIQYRDPEISPAWRFDVYPVVRGDLHYEGVAGEPIEPPLPIRQMPPYCSESYGESGPFWEDRTGRHWALAGGSDGGTADAVLHWFYPVWEGFSFPSGTAYPHAPGDHVPWLDRAESPAGTPVDTVYTIAWPEQVPELRVGETLVKAKFGLPDVSAQASVAIVYQQSIAAGGGPSAHLMDPTRVRTAPLASLPLGVPAEMDSSLGEYRFPELPPHLYERLSYDGGNHRLNLRGVLIEPPIGEYYLLPNVITGRDRDVLADVLGAALADDLRELAAEPILVGTGDPPAEPDDTLFDSRAVTAGAAAATGYVTLAFQDNAALCPPDLPVSLEIIRVTCPLYQGQIKVVEPASPLYESLTLRHSGDFAGYSDDLVFEWRTLPDSGGTPPQHGGEVRPEYWNTYVPGTSAGAGVVDITISGPGLFTLTDNWFVCRYRPAAETVQPCGSGWSEWTEPQLAEGWIKRVVRGINPYEQRFRDLGDPTRTLNTLVTMISQAGPRYEGSVALNPAAVDEAGLIEIYQTVLNRGIGLSIEGTPPVSSDVVPGITNALLLAAGRIAQLYMLLGNEAYGDACDPTLGFGLNPSEAYIEMLPSIHAFLNQTSSLLEEELALLRGRDDMLAPGTRQAPIYNRLAWNFTSGLGEVAYALNYDLCDDITGEPDGVLDEADAKRLYPQGHGDAWGHYLTAMTGYYRLLREPNFTWVPRSEAVTLGGVPVTVDYLDERLFAAAAAAKARTGAEIVNLIYRAKYSEDPEGQWQGYKDSDPERAWGLAEWGLRAGQGAYLDWMVANAILPSDDRDVGWFLDDISLWAVDDPDPDAAPSLLFSEDFEGGAGNWSSTGEWHLAESAESIDPWYHSGVAAMACTGSSGVYGTGCVHVLERVEPAAVPAGAHGVTLSWWDYVGLRPGGDSVRVEVGVQSTDDNGTPEDPDDDVVSYAWAEVYSSTADRKMWGTLDPADPATVIPVQVSLDAYAGETIRIRFVLAADSPQALVGDVRRIDRTTVPELGEIIDAYRDMQTQVDNADVGLSPLGLAANAVPFDIDPLQIDTGKTHFEQIYDRAVLAVENAVTAFGYAAGSRQMLQRQADELQEFQKTVQEREIDFRNRLIEVFGYPYVDDIGPGKSYPSGYAGPDLYHYMIVDTSELLGVQEDRATLQTFRITYEEDHVNADGTLTPARSTVEYHLSTTGLGIVKPASWTGQRRAQGELQFAHGDLLQALGRFERALDTYNALLADIEGQAELLQAQYQLNASEILILNEGIDTQEGYNDKIMGARKRQAAFRSAAVTASLVADALAEFLPKSVGLSTDATSGARGAIKMVGAVVARALECAADWEGLNELDAQLAKDLAQAQTNLKVTTLHGQFAALQLLTQLEQMLRQESSVRYDLYVLQEALQQAQQQYLAALARGQRLLEDRLRFRRQTAAGLQEMRYRDMAFRIFRNDALQKYRAQFDLAARYAYLAARAYDYETNLLDEDARGPGSEFLTRIVRARAVGLMQNGVPQLAGTVGDRGLADPLARMMLNWQLVLKGQLGFNNPQTETNRFSLRRELFHLSAAAEDDQAWRNILWSCCCDNLLEEPAFRRYCRSFQPQQATEPGLVLPFATHIEFGANFFGLPLWGGDSAYDSSNFTTKIRSAGVWFSNYNTLAQSGLSNTPRVYLIPIGEDRSRSPTGYAGETREWTVLDQLIPMPFPINGGDLTDPDWIPLYDTLTGELASIRRYPSFRAYHDSGNFSDSEVTRDSRLIGRSVWNTHWLLIIPAGTLHSDRLEARRRLVFGLPMAGGPVLDDQGQARDGNGISDIRIFFQTYAYSGAKKTDGMPRNGGGSSE